MILLQAGLLSWSLLALGTSPGVGHADAPTDPYANNACVNCHADLPGRSSELVELEWKQSVHHDAKVGCDGCHGGNAAVRREAFDSDEQFKQASHLKRNPEFLVMNKPQDNFVSSARGRSVSYFCGRCHAEIKEKHLGSPHGDFGNPTCLYCHGQGSHRITDATPEIIDPRSRVEDGRCSPCHTTSTMQVVAQIKKTLLNTEDLISTSGEQYKQLESWGYRNLKLEELHHHAAEVQSRLRRIFHSFSLRNISNFSGEIQDIADRTTATYELVEHLHHTRRQQTLVGLGAVTLLLVFVVVLVYYKHNFLEKDHGHQ